MVTTWPCVSISFAMKPPRELLGWDFYHGLMTNTVDTDQIKCALEEIGNLAGDLSKESYDEVMENQAIKVLFEHSEEYFDKLRKSNGPLSAFWMSYVDMVEHMLHIIRASREGGWMLHRSSMCS